MWIKETTKRLSRSRWCEVLLYFSVYISYLLYGLRKVYDVRNDILRISKYEFAAGWSWLGRPRDDNNDELEYFNVYVVKMWPWYVLHLSVSALLSRWRPQNRCLGHALVSIAALLYCMQTISIILIGGLLCSYFIAAQTGRKAVTWFLSALWILLIILIKFDRNVSMALGYVEYYTLIVMMSWSVLRGSSFSLERINALASRDEELYSVAQFLGYTLYLPTLVYGPLISFRRYAAMWKGEKQEKQGRAKIDTRTRWLTLIWELLRVAFWWFVLQLALHYLYLHYMAKDMFALRLVQPAFSHHAVGYFMGQFFFIYYVITYGMGIAVAHFDGIDAPQRPRCVGRIHFYSDMWKYFDEGLYEFLFNHIYAELCKKRSSLYAKLVATATTFVFVFLWHGCYIYVLIWSVLNFTCLVAEKCFKALMSYRPYSQWATKHLGTRGAQRLYALLGTQIFIPAAFANVYFIAGMEVGGFLMRGAYRSGLVNYIALTFCSYCFFQCSEVILNLKRGSKF